MNSVALNLLDSPFVHPHFPLASERVGGRGLGECKDPDASLPSLHLREFAGTLRGSPFSNTAVLAPRGGPGDVGVSSEEPGALAQRTPKGSRGNGRETLAGVVNPTRKEHVRFPCHFCRTANRRDALPLETTCLSSQGLRKRALLMHLWITLCISLPKNYRFFSLFFHVRFINVTGVSGT